MFRSSGTKRLVPAVALASGIALLAAGCGNGDDKKENNATGGTTTAGPSGSQKPTEPGTEGKATDRTLAVWAGAAPPFKPNFNPYAASAAQGGTLGPMYETLFFFNKAGAEDKKGLLAESAEFNDDGTEMTIKIKTGVKWSDGKEFTVDDVIFSFTNPGAKPKYLKSADKVDESTVKLTFDGAAYTNEYAILGTTYMVPKHVFDGKSADALAKFANDKDPVVTGPYILKSANAQGYSITANPNFREEGKPLVKNVQYYAVENNNAAENLLKTGKLDWAGMFVADPGSLTADGRLGYINTPMDPTVLYTCANAEKGCKGSQTDVAVRQALNVAIDRDTINKKAFSGQAGKISPTFALLGRDDKWIGEGQPTESPQKGDPAAAAKILEEAGYEKGGDGIYAKDGKRVSMTLWAVVSWSDYENVAKLVAEQTKAAGIEIKAENVPFEKFNEGRFDGKFELAVGGVVGTSIPDPYQIYRDWFSSDFTQPVGTPLGSGQWNFSRYSNPKVDEAVKTASGTNDEAKKKEAYATIQAEIVRDVPMIPVVINATQVFYNVKDYTGWPTQDNLYAFPPSWGAVSAGQVLTNIAGK